MATRAAAAAGQEWNKQRATFHARHGQNISLSTSGSVATRANNGHSVVFTEGQIAEGSMLRVAVLEYNEECAGGLGVFFTSEDPSVSELSSSPMAAMFNQPGQGKLIGVCNNKIFYRGRPLGTKHNLTKSTDTLTVGHSVGIRLMDGNKLLLYYNDVLFETFQFKGGYPRKTPMWGVVDVYGKITKVKADIRTPKQSRSPEPKKLKKSASVNYPPVKEATAAEVPDEEPDRKRSIEKSSNDESNDQLKQQIRALQKQLDKVRRRNQKMELELEESRMKLEEEKERVLAIEAKAESAKLFAEELAMQKDIELEETKMQLEKEKESLRACDIEAEFESASLLAAKTECAELKKQLEEAKQYQLSHQQLADSEIAYLKLQLYYEGLTVQELKAENVCLQMKISKFPKQEFNDKVRERDLARSESNPVKYSQNVSEQYIWCKGTFNY